MSVNLSKAAVASFDAMVHHQFQANGHVLRPHVRVKTGVVGSTHRFPIMRPGVATQRGAPQTEVIPMNVDHGNATATLLDWVAPEYTDVFTQAKVNFDEKAELSKVIAMAMGRRDDQVVIDALVATVGPKQVSTDIGGTGTNMNIEKLLAAKAALDRDEVPTDGRTIVIHANQLQTLLTETSVTSSDFNTIKALVRGEIDTYLGFKFVTIGTRPEGGLALATGVRKAWAWQKEAVGLAEGIAMRTSIDWIPTRVSHLCNALFSAGAVSIDPLGIVEISCTDAGVA